MAYSPRMSPRSLCRLRRIAWAIDQPMTRTLDRIIDFVGSRIDPRRVCDACRDPSACNLCALTSPEDTQSDTE